MLRRFGSTGGRFKVSLLGGSLRAPMRWSSFAADNIPKTDPIGHAVDPKSLMMRKTYELSTNAETGEQKSVATVLEPYLSRLPQDQVRNFAIIAHVDHGKTTLSDSIMRRVGLLDADREVGTFLDKLDVEKERGITVKAQTCTMFVKHPKTKKEYMLTLVDTPGHVDFSFEVARSLRASEGAVLLVDGRQGIQAQTMANMYLAMDCDSTLIPALTKLDSVIDEGKVLQILSDVEDTLGFSSKASDGSANEVIWTSAKEKLGIENLLEAVIDRVPPPKGDAAAPFRGLVFDTWTDGKGRILLLVRVADGTITVRDTVGFAHKEKQYAVKEVGIMHPEPVPCQELRAGHVGYVDIGVTSNRDACTGETLCSAKNMKTCEPLPGFTQSKPCVFAGFFPDEDDQFEGFEESVRQLCLNDPSVEIAPLQCSAFGKGLQLGFLGTLHLQVFQDRLMTEFERSVLVTPPQIFYKYVDLKGKEHPLNLYSWIDKHEGVREYLEPWVKATVICLPDQFASVSQEITTNYRGEQLDSKLLDTQRMVGRFRMPFDQLVGGFNDKLKSMTKGYGMLEYDELQYEEADLVRLEVMVNKAKVPALSQICIRDEAQRRAKRLVSTLKENLDRTIVDLPIQAVLNTKIIARETLGATRKDVTAKCHGGHPQRAMKKLEQQKKGKAKLAKRMVGQCSVSQEAIRAVMGV